MGVVLSTGRYNPDERAIVSADGRTALTPLEGKLLDYFIDHAGKTVTHKQLLTDVWGYAEGVRTRAVYAAVERLRRKIEREPGTPQHLFSRPRVGYRFALAPQRLGSTDLIGRQQELRALLAALGAGQVVSLLGAGGAGKTRLAMELAAVLQERGDAVCLCLAAGARSAAGLESILATALQIPLLGSVRVQLGHVLHQRGEMTLIIDNVEQLVGALPPLLRQWRAVAPALCVVLTSRVRPTLDEIDTPIAVEPLPDALAIALLRQRAQRLRPDLVADDAVLLDIARAVDKLPLGLEMAAARLHLMPAALLAQRLTADLSILRGGDQRPTRHETMQAVVAWSWTLLSADEQQALARCTLFTAPFDADLAAAVFADLGAPLDRLAALLDHHLLRSAQGRVPLFSLFEPVRAYLGAQTIPAPVVRAYARACISRGPPLDTLVLSGKEPGEGWARLKDALPHLKQASALLLAQGDTDLATDCAVLAWQVYSEQGPLQDGVDLLEAALAQADPVPPLRLGLTGARAYRRAARPADAAALLDALQPETPEEQAQVCLATAFCAQNARRLQESAALFTRALKTTADPLLSAEARMGLAVHEMFSGRYDQAQQQLEELRLHVSPEMSLTLSTEVDRLLARVLLSSRQLSRSRELLERILAYYDTYGLGRHRHAVLEVLGFIHFVQGDLTRAQALLSEALAHVQQLGRGPPRWSILRSLGWIGVLTGDLSTARMYLSRAVREPREAGAPDREVLALWRLAEAERRAGDHVAAQLHLDRADTLWRPGRFVIERARAETVRGMLAVDMGDRDRALAALEQARAPLARRPPGAEHFLEQECAALQAALGL